MTNILKFKMLNMSGATTAQLQEFHRQFSFGILCAYQLLLSGIMSNLIGRINRGFRTPLSRFIPHGWACRNEP